MANTEIQEIDVKVQVREAGDLTWKELVCDIDKQFQLTNDTTETETRCTTFIGVSNVKGNMSGNAVFNIGATGSQITWDDVAGWQIDKQKLEMLVENLAFTSSEGNPVAEGAAVHIFLAGRFVDSTLQFANKDIGKFSWTFKPTTITLGGHSS